MTMTLAFPHLFLSLEPAALVRSFKSICARGSAGDRQSVPPLIKTTCSFPRVVNAYLHPGKLIARRDYRVGDLVSMPAVREPFKQPALGKRGQLMGALFSCRAFAPLDFSRSAYMIYCGCANDISIYAHRSNDKRFTESHFLYVVHRNLRQSVLLCECLGSSSFLFSPFVHLQTVHFNGLTHY